MMRQRRRRSERAASGEWRMANGEWKSAHTLCRRRRRRIKHLRGRRTKNLNLRARPKVNVSATRGPHLSLGRARLPSRPASSISINALGKRARASIKLIEINDFYSDEPRNWFASRGIFSHSLRAAILILIPLVRASSAPPPAQLRRHAKRPEIFRWRAAFSPANQLACFCCHKSVSSASKSGGGGGEIARPSRSPERSCRAISRLNAPPAQTRSPLPLDERERTNARARKRLAARWAA